MSYLNTLNSCVVLHNNNKINKPVKEEKIKLYIMFVKSLSCNNQNNKNTNTNTNTINKILEEIDIHELFDYCTLYSSWKIHFYLDDLERSSIEASVFEVETTKNSNYEEIIKIYNNFINSNIDVNNINVFYTTSDEFEPNLNKDNEDSMFYVVDYKYLNKETYNCNIESDSSYDNFYIHK